MKQIIFIFLSCTLIINVFAQTPSNDANWVKNNSKSDEFNGSSLDSKWNAMSPSSFRYGLEIYQTNYVQFDGTNLKLKSDKIGSEYWTGGIKSASANYHYGYFEIVATIPKGKGFWTAFWLHADKWNPWPDKREWYDEIDILEPGGCQSINADINEVGIWEKDGDKTIKKYATYVYSGLPDLSATEHRFAVEWLPNYVVFYFNGQPFNKFCNNSAIPTHPMTVLINQEIGKPSCEPNSITDAKLPQYFKINWFRYYELDFDCTDAITSSEGNGFNFSTFDYKVKKSFTLSNTSVPSGSKVTLRANEFVELSNNFTVPLGSEFVISATPCY